MRITVIVHRPAIFAPGPARPRIAPDRIFSRVAHCDGDAADSSVCGSSIRTRLGRMDEPSGRVCFRPRIRPVMPDRRTQAPADFAPGIHGSVTVSADQSISVGRPWYSCPLARWAIRSRQRIGKQASGKSSRSRSLFSIWAFMLSAIVIDAAWSAPMIATNGQWP